MYIKQTRDEFRAKTSGHEQMPKQKNMPESVNQISWVRAQEMKVDKFFRLLGSHSTWKTWKNNRIFKNLIKSLEKSWNFVSPESGDPETGTKI